MILAHPKRHVAVVLAAAGFLLLGTVLVLGLWRPWAPLETPAAVAAGPTSNDVAPAPPSQLSLPDDPSVLVFGDSWTYGSAATERTLGYAYRFGALEGWQTTVDGVRGSGYLKPGRDGPDFGERMAALDPRLAPDLIVVQGSINDRHQDLSRYDAAVDAAWDTLETTYPDASVVVLGPAPQVLPVEAPTAEIDERLTRLAADRGWPYISPVQEEWITEDDYTRLIDTSKRGADHPSDAGHAYLAERLAAAVDAMTAPLQVEAAEPQVEPAAPAVSDVYEAPSAR